MKTVTEDDIWKAIVESISATKLQPGEILFSDLQKFAPTLPKKKFYIELRKLIAKGLITSRKLYSGNPVRLKVAYKIKDQKALKDYLGRL